MSHCRTMRASGVFVVLVTAALAGCGSPSPPACPNLLPPSCPSPAPSFSADVDPIIQGHCAPCHAPDGIEPTHPFQTYDQIFAQRTQVLSQVHACKMPPDGGVPLSDDEKRTLLGWLVCDAPNN